MAKDYRKFAELLKVVAHPARLVILERLEQGVLCVSDMEGLLDAPQPYISQHLSLMRRAGLVDYYMDGRQRCYFLKDPLVLGILALTRNKYKASLKPPACCPAKKPAAQKL